MSASEWMRIFQLEGIVSLYSCSLCKCVYIVYVGCILFVFVLVYLRACVCICVRVYVRVCYMFVCAHVNIHTSMDVCIVALVRIVCAYPDFRRMEGIRGPIT